MSRTMDATSRLRGPSGRLHYGWAVAAAGCLVMFACLGLARFAFGILLPSMAQGLDLSYAQRGYVGTGYFLGYLAMVAVAPRLSRRLGNVRSILLGLGLIAATMALLGLAGTYSAALLAYTLTGVGSGAANISMMALVAAWFARPVRGLAAGLVIAGNGLGIVTAGFLAPAVVAAGDWRWGWLVLAGLVALALLAAWLVLRESPGVMGLAMVGQDPAIPPSPAPPASIPSRERAFLLRLGAVYSLFGLTYIVYGTFIVTTLVDEYGFGQDVAGRFWAWVGLFSLFSGALIGKLSDRKGRRLGLAAAFAMQTAAYLLAGLGDGSLALYLSVGLYGLAAWSVPTVMTAMVADRLGPERTAAGFAFITFFFAAGQVAGPALAGILADALGGFRPAYTLSAAGAALAALLALRLPPTAKPAR
ncbi:MAG: MFS transporter [Thermodesulfobacteriota bacterium]